MGCKTLHYRFWRGDPILRSDISSLIKITSDGGINTSLTTKSRLNKSRLSKLKESGLSKLNFSIDSHISEIAEKLTGVHSFNGTVKSIRDAVKIGLNVSANAVITSYNVSTLHETVPFLAGLGEKEIELTPYSASCGRHNINYYPSKIDMMNLDKEINKINKSKEFQNNKILYSFNYGEAYEEELINLSMRRSICGGCKSIMPIRPDGKVVYCEPLLRSDELIVGDLSKLSIKEVWDSKDITNIITPDKELFINTDCYECSDFKKCSPLRCYKRVLIDKGKLFDRDPLCHHGNGNRYTI